MCRSRRYQGCSAQSPTFQEQIREITESLPIQGWPLFFVGSACTALAAYTALQILLWDYKVFVTAFVTGLTARTLYCSFSLSSQLTQAELKCSVTFQPLSGTYWLQNRRTDDPTEEDRSESYSIKEPKTYTWKQENIRTGKLPKKPEERQKEQPPPEKLKPPENILAELIGPEDLPETFAETK